MSSIKKKSSVLLFFLVMFIAYTVMPVVSLYISSIARVILLLSIIILLIGDSGIDRFLKNIGKLLPIYIIPLMNIVFIIINGSGGVDVVIYDFAGKIILSCVYLHIAEEKGSLSSRRLLISTIVIYFVTAVTTIYGNFLFPTASRQLATGMTGESVLYNQYRAMNIGGFNYVYELVMLSAILPFLYKKKIINRQLTLLFYILILACAYYTEYTTALLVVLLCGSFFFVDTLQGMKTLLRNMVVIGVLILISASFILSLLSSIESDILSARFTDLGSIVSGSTTNENSDVDVRQSLYLQSIDAFLSNPLIGTGTNGGGHSFILDNLAKYGLLGLLAWYIMLRSMYKSFVKRYKSTSFYGYILLGFMVYVLLLVVNPHPLYIGVTFLVPLIAHELRENINNGLKGSMRV